MTLLSRGLVVLALLLTAVWSGSDAASAQTTTWKYTALGDSLATGIFASKGYVPRYRDAVQLDNRVSVSLTNLGQNGWRSSDLLAALQSDSTFRQSVTSAKVVTWNIGGNDLRRARDSYKAKTCGGSDNQDCLRSTVAEFQTNWDAIIVEILALRTPGTTIVRTMDIYNPYVGRDRTANTWPNDAGSDLQVFKVYLDQVNAHIASTATSNNIPYAKVYLAFNGTSGTEDPAAKGYLAFDRLHPSDTGHQVIASRLRNLGYTPTP